MHRPERRPPLRFVWQIDETGRFTLSSDEFIRLAGARTLAAIGRSWREVAQTLQVDPEDQVSRAMAEGKAWSGIKLLWPVEHSAERLAIELSGRPVLDSACALRGYRGLGVGSVAVTPHAIDQPAEAAHAAPDVPQSSENAVPACPPTAESIAPTLSPHEHSAFDELSRKLAQSLATTDRAAEAAERATCEHDLGAGKKTGQPLGRESAQPAQIFNADLFANVAHEILTSLNSILGLSGIIMQEPFGPIGDERYRGYVRDIHDCGEQLRSDINGLLQLAKIDAGQLELRPQSVSLNDIVRQFIAIEQPQANRFGVIIRSSLLAALPEIITDVESLRQMVLSLISHAIKLARAGGQVIVSTNLNEAGEAVLRVRGSRMAANGRDFSCPVHPFRPAVTAAQSRAHGLGLSLPRALARANGAAFQLTGTPADGTLVQIAFPARGTVAR
ncbi:MAG: histidine kinase dimerization/phospho-acceptor domain-containing protein [Xanthobacteraceae bacterium]